jgi:predicted CXXCH cytochrome family protein
MSRLGMIRRLRATSRLRTIGRRTAFLFAAVVVAVVAGTAGSVLLKADRGDRFPHDQHARMFPLCTGCHEGVESGDRSAYFPSPQLCANCHDGTVAAPVEWTGPRAHLTNLVFEHTHHVAVAAREGMTLECEQCHTPAGAARMVIERANPQVCFACHAHPATDHFVDANCQTCHVAFVESDLPPTRLATLPVPADHHVPGFMLQGHGLQAQADIRKCAVCHTRERCTSCHVNVPDVPQIAALPAAPASWVLPAYAAHYPVPPSHLTPEWVHRHGPSASRQQCAACHTREDCTSCHVPPGPGLLGEFPARAQVTAPGAVTLRQMPLSHASRWFDRQHASIASSQPESCRACHTQTFCSDCHDAPVNPTYHPRNFAAQHSSQAYSRRMECSTCHEVRTFCRSCHIQLGMNTEGRLNPGFHDAEPLWLLRHARAARQGLESCTSCHVQRDCMQCHTELGSFQISPHGPNFDARRAQQRNAVICFACHVTDPLANGRR